MAQVFVITGPSGVGKGTLIGKLRERVGELELSVSATTRDPRPGEVDGVDYHFLTDSDFERRLQAGQFLEWASYGGSRYGTLRTEVEERLSRDRSVVLEIEVQGARQIAKTRPDAVRIFIAPPSFETLRERLRRRGTDSDDSIERRLREAEAELEARNEFPVVIVNDDLDSATERLAGTVTSALRSCR